MEDQIAEVEDYLQQNSVFVNGISGKPAHQDSYMTIVDLDALNKCIENCPFDKNQVKKSIEYWLEDPNNQPPLKIVARIWEKMLND